MTGCLVTCENEPITVVASPNQRQRAVVFSRNCGATTGPNTQLSILAPGEAQDGAGNTFIADGKVPLKLQWIADAELVVHGSRGSRTFKQEKHVIGVVIAYR